MPLLLMGDTAQLPPVGEELSPALYADALRGYGLEVVETDLTQVVGRNSNRVSCGMRRPCADSLRRRSGRIA